MTERKRDQNREKKPEARNEDSACITPSEKIVYTLCDYCEIGISTLVVTGVAGMAWELSMMRCCSVI